MKKKPTGMWFYVSLYWTKRSRLFIYILYRVSTMDNRFSYNQGNMGQTTKTHHVYGFFFCFVLFSFGVGLHKRPAVHITNSNNLHTLARLEYRNSFVILPVNTNHPDPDR
jgi:hypothetical protein